MEFISLTEYKEKVINFNIKSNPVNGLNFHDAEILRILVKNGDLYLKMRYDYHSNWCATLIFKNVTLKDFCMSCDSKSPTIIFEIYVAEDGSGKIHTQIDFCISKFDSFYLICDQIILEDYDISSQKNN